MAICSACHTANPEANRFCSHCGVSLVSHVDEPTVVMREVARPNSTRTQYSAVSSAEEGRFPPGTIILERYRVMGLLGRGGMGEVFRATDLVLGQQVALKFLPAAMAQHPEMLARFHSEVRIARQVSHPNVCRVYDIGEHEGAPYISMEYVDGEDLATLLRRIGRMPTDKSIEVARKLCAGLAAAHDKGVLHRDLKPANVMLDSRGQVYIMDFGLAGLAQDMKGAEIRNGTPAYMAPEQLAGREVTMRSDIYALALVLYEMFTGRKAFEANSLVEMQRLQEQATPVSLTDLVRDIDPLVERVILRCLSPDPKQRPASALAVAAALPGGDPLAAALAAGETPSPQMVAAAGENALMKIWVAVALFAGTLAGLVLLLFLNENALTNRWPLEKSPASLESDAQQLIRNLGYPAKPASYASGFDIDGDVVNYISSVDKGNRRWAEAPAKRKALITFWYRQSPAMLQGLEENDSTVTYSEPAPVGSGMISVQMDSEGRLLAFHAVPPEKETTPGEAAAVDWQPLLHAAGLDAAQLKPVKPQWNELEASDTRMAWTGALPEDAGVPIRVEAQAKEGKPVSFRIAAPWSRPARMESAHLNQGQRANQIIQIFMVMLVAAAGFALARHNLRKKRGDVRGALRLGVVVLVLTLATYLFGASHVAGAGEFSVILRAIGRGLSFGVVACLLYIALEPYLRRRWPHSLISWNIAMAGNWRSPLVGSDLLIGGATGVLWALLAILENLAVQKYGARPHVTSLDAVSTWTKCVSQFMGLANGAIANSMIIVLVIFLLRLVLRKGWLTTGGFLVFFLMLNWFSLYRPFAEAPFVLLIGGMIFTVISRSGLLPYVLAIAIFEMLVLFPMTTNLSAWWSTGTWLMIIVVTAISGYGLHTALGGRSLVRADLLD